MIEEKLGYLVLRFKSGQGVIIADELGRQIEIRLCKVDSDNHQAKLAIQAPKAMKIRRLGKELDGKDRTKGTENAV